MCHAFIQNKLKMPPPMDVFSDFLDDFNPKAANVHEVSHEGKNANLDQNWKKCKDLDVEKISSLWFHFFQVKKHWSCVQF